MDKPTDKTGLIRELARRRVFRSAGAYVVVAWVAIQVASIVFPEFNAPEWAMRAMIIVFVAGFPPAMLAAWTLDLSRDGLQRTTDSNFTRTHGVWPAVAVTLTATALSAGATALLWDKFIVLSEPRITRSDIKSQPVIAVAAPRQISGAPGNEWLGDGIANLIRSDLSESQHVIVVSQAHSQLLASESTGQSNGVAKQWRDSGIDYLIDGEIFETPDGIVLTTYLEDLDSGVQIVSPRISGADAAEVIARIPQLATEIKRALRIPHRERVGLFEADFAIDNVAAYEMYIAGLDYQINFDFKSAENAFKRVLEIAPNYHIARYRLALIYELTGRPDLAKSTLDEIPDNADLTRRLQLYVDGARSWFVADRDIEKAISIYEKLVEEYPYETEAGTLLGESYWLDFQDDAAIAEFRRLLDIHPYDPTAWMALGERLLDVGELDEAKAILERYATMVPDDPYAHALLGNLALQQGDLGNSIMRHRKALEVRPGFAVAMLGLARGEYLRNELPAATALWQQLVEDSEVATGYRIDAAFDLSRTLRGRGNFREAIRPIESTMPLIEEENIRLPMALAESALLYLELGEVETAQSRAAEAVQKAAAPATRYLFARGMLELRLEQSDALRLTIAALHEPPDNGEDEDGTRRMAGNYLAGLAAIDNGDQATAGELLQSVLEDDGFRYALYELGLAQQLGASGEYQRAATVAREASLRRDADDLRLDLELDRARALLFHAECLARGGDTESAARVATHFIGLWHDAAPDRPELERAQDLAAGVVPESACRS